LVTRTRGYAYCSANGIRINTTTITMETIINNIVTLPDKYVFPQTYIINMAKCTKKRDYIHQQMIFQSNTNFKFIDAIDGSTDSETGALMKKYFQYMNVRKSSQAIEFDRTTVLSSYKNKYNSKRQHINRGSLGLIQSAFLLMNEFVKSHSEHALILEDDVYTLKDLDGNLFANKHLFKGKDLIYLGCHTYQHNIYPEKSGSIFIDIANCPYLIYGTYAIIISKQLAQYILDLGIDRILHLNLSWDLLLNYIRDTRKEQFTFFLYFKQLFIPNVIKDGGINPIKDVSFYSKNKIMLHDYYIPGVTKEHTDTDIASIMSTHNEKFFFEFVNKVVYINLSHRVDRKEHIEEQLTKYITNSKIRRFDAIRNEKGAIGCALSHIAVLEMAIAENWDSVFIVEDDFMWTEHFASGYDILKKLIQKDYDVIVLGGSFVKSYKNSFKLISCNCALSYIINKTYYEKLLKCFKQAVEELTKTYDPSKYAIDQAWKHLQRRDNWYIIKPNMGIQIPTYSDIENIFRDYSSYFDINLEYDDEIDPQLTKEYLNLLETKTRTGYRSIRYYKIDDRFNENYNTNWLKNIKIPNMNSSFEELSIPSAEEIIKRDTNVDKIIMTGLRLKRFVI